MAPVLVSPQVFSFRGRLRGKSSGGILGSCPLSITLSTLKALKTSAAPPMWSGCGV